MHIIFFESRKIEDTLQFWVSHTLDFIFHQFDLFPEFEIILKELGQRGNTFVGVVDTTVCFIEQPYYNQWEYFNQHYYTYAFKYQVKVILSLKLI